MSKHTLANPSLCRAARSVVEVLETRRLLATSALDVPGAADPSRFYLVGNSMTDGILYSGMYAYLSRHGDAVSQGRQSSGGRSISQLFNLEPTPAASGFDPARPGVSNPWGNYTTAFNSQWDVLTVQPHDRRHLTDVVEGRDEAEVSSILQWMHALSENSPDGQVFLYSRPLRISDTPSPFDYSRDWVLTYEDTGETPSRNFFSRSSVTQLMDKMRAAQVEDSIASTMPLVKLIPVGEAYFIIDQMIDAGRFAGTAVTSMQQFYSDLSHPSFDLGSYVFALTFNASLTGNDPRGIAPNSAYLPNGTILTDTRIQALIQEAVYQAMHFPGYAGWLNSAGDGIASAGMLRLSVRDDSGDPLPGAAAYVDLDGNGTRDADEPVAIADDAGVAVFDGLDAGTFDVRLVGASATKRLTVVAGRLTKSTLTSSTPAGTTSTSPGSIRVQMFADMDLDARFDTGESPLPGDIVFIDLDRDGTLDVAEARKTVDATGSAVFTGLAPGQYAVGLLPSDNGNLTSFVHRDIELLGGTERVVEIGLAAREPVRTGTGTSGITGNVFDDLNGNATQNTGEPPVAGVPVWIDLDLDGIKDASEPTRDTDSQGGYSFSDIPANTYVVRVVVPGGWAQTLPRNNAGVSVTVGVGQTKTASPILITDGVVGPPPVTASISGRTYNDTNANGVFDPGETPVARVVFLDTDNDGALDQDETAITSKSDGTFTFNELVAGLYRVRRVFPSGYKPSNPPRDYTLAGNEAITGADIGSVTSGTIVTPPPTQTGSISGFTFDDSNRNGVLDTGENKTSGKTVFLDSNNNGKLDTGEKSTKTNTSGAYSFIGLAAGTYYVRRVFPSGYTYSNTPLDLTLAAGQTIGNANIGSQSGTTPPPPSGAASISGFLFWDSDRDGKFDTGESLQTGKTVFIDLDDDNILDSNEKKLTSDSKGAFKFTGLSAGTYVIKRVVPSGYKITTPKQVVTLTAGQIFSGVAIGTNTN